MKTIRSLAAAASLVTAAALAPGRAVAHDRDEDRAPPPPPAWSDRDDLRGPARPERWEGRLEEGRAAWRDRDDRGEHGGRGDEARLERERDGWRRDGGRFERDPGRERECLLRIHALRAELARLERERFELSVRFAWRPWRLARFDAPLAARQAELERQLAWLTGSLPPWLARR
jgi:hypothetical protein